MYPVKGSSAKHPLKPNAASPGLSNKFATCALFGGSDPKTTMTPDAAESLFGPYDWDRYDILVMPPSFPYGGMENPRLTFLTPQTINVIVGNLEKMGAIRKSADAAHGRILRLSATAKGQTLLKRCRAVGDAPRITPGIPAGGRTAKDRK